jgi:hypothetical protein
MPLGTNPADPHAQTRAATETRQRKVTRRLELVEAFLTEMDQKAHDGNRHRDRFNMPFTKHDFWRTAQQVIAELKGYSDSAIADSVRKCGGVFMRGVKSRTNNPLEELFPAQTGGISSDEII